MIRRSLIEHHGRAYYAPELYSRNHRVIIGYDLQEPGWINVYLESGEFLCRAIERQAVHPAARILGTEQDVIDLTRQIEIKKSQEKQAATPARQLLEMVVIPETQARLASIEAKRELPAPETAAKPMSQAKVKAIESAKTETRKRMAEAPAYTPPAEVRSILSELDKYSYLFDLREKDGMELREADAEWMEQWEQSDAYPADRFAMLRKLYARQRARQVNG
jgi:putative transposase